MLSTGELWAGFDRLSMSPSCFSSCLSRSTKDLRVPPQYCFHMMLLPQYASPSPFGGRSGQLRSAQARVTGRLSKRQATVPHAQPSRMASEASWNGICSGFAVKEGGRHRLTMKAPSARFCAPRKCTPSRTGARRCAHASQIYCVCVCVFIKLYINNRATRP